MTEMYFLFKIKVSRVVEMFQKHFFIIIIFIFIIIILCCQEYKATLEDKSGTYAHEKFGIF